MVIIFLLFFLPHGMLFCSPEKSEPDTISLTIMPESYVAYEAPIRMVFVARSKVEGINQNIRGSVVWIPGILKPEVIAYLNIGAASFDSGNRTRDRDVSNILNAESYPEITFELSDILGLENKPLSELSGEYLAVGTLTVHGVTNEIRIPVFIHYLNNRLTIEGSVGIKYTDYGIDPPRAAGFVTRAPNELRLRAFIVASTNRN